MQQIFIDDSALNVDCIINNGMDLVNFLKQNHIKTNPLVGVEINNILCDLFTDYRDFFTPNNRDITLITKNHPQALNILRHDCAHILAQAIKTLYPEAQITIGPVIDNGFYYDVAYNLNLDDLEKIEQEMHKIVQANHRLTKHVYSYAQAVEYFFNKGEHYKVELIKDLHNLQQIDSFTLYEQGDFLDLCKGPHGPNTGLVGKNFKLTKLAGAYWRGNSANAMLTRIYGTYWHSKEDLNNYLQMLEEARQNDHRKLGKELDFFHLQEEARGSVFWHPKGWTLYNIIRDYIKQMYAQFNYREVNTPLIMNRVLWERSGHWDKFGDKMFTTRLEDQDFALKPMNCPGHIQIFNQGLKSYRDLPLRIAEFGHCHRAETSGSLHGIMRVWHFVQDDGHIFCTPHQIGNEAKVFFAMLQQIYSRFGFNNLKIKFSDRPKVRAGTDKIWDRAEEALKTATLEAGLNFELNSGEGAFYGPKLEFIISDAMNREWQCGTLQVDFILPERLGAHYIDERGEKCTPVMLHRAVLGSLERFIGILLENHKGALPFWLAPVQVVVCPISQGYLEYAQSVLDILQRANIRAEVDISSEKINYKIRKHMLQKINILLIVGQREMQENLVSIRTLGSSDTLTINLAQLIAYLDNLK